ncbi:MAG: Asparagine synthetase (Glutamine-hydrolyzing) [uncultured bacterium]|nr:MAG: Asparagine synthetase (Glutamine-hydrolyzing) [uncultured bacterium]
MCGITGIVYNNNSNELQCVTDMTSAIHSRGPDDHGVWLDQAAGVAFGHRRLSIIDLSAAGHQPMHSASKRYVITYNGEIYNYLDIRKELNALGVRFVGHSDTEVVLAAIEVWGIVEAIKRFNGMFAFAIWDAATKKIYLARDRFGEKPLYYGWINNTLIFGSELKALKKYHPWQPRVLPKAVALFLRYSYVPAPFSIYEDIYKITPGTILEIDDKKNQKQYIYWSAVSAAKEAAQKIKTFDANNEQVVLNELHSCLATSVKQRCVSDVPVGVFLSGGIDSSLVASLMQEQNSCPVKTFTIGFHEKFFNNEAPTAKKIAGILQTEHTEHYVSLKEMLDVVPKLPEIYDEPFADSSQIPTYIVSSLARQQVKVCLSGDGGDELFGGYNRYVWLNKIYQLSQRFPSLFPLLAKIFTEKQLDAVSAITNKICPKLSCVAALGQKMHKTARSLCLAKSQKEFYANIVSTIINPEDIMATSPHSSPGSYDDVANGDWANNNDFVHWMMLADTVSYLPGDILTKVDRASMGVGLEVRTPYLDPEVYSFAWSLPLGAKIHDHKNKYLLRKLLARFVPQKILDLPKVGFGAPIGAWLKGPLKDWAENLIDENKLEQQQYLRSDVVKKYWQEHLSGKKDWSYLMWNILMFQAWLEKNE